MAKLVSALILAAVALNTMGYLGATRPMPGGREKAASQDIRVNTSATTRGEAEDVIGTLADGYIAIVNSTFLTDQAVEWNPRHLQIAEQAFEDAVMNSDYGYASRRKGFGSLSRWAQALGATQAPPACRTGCTFAGGAIRLAYTPTFINGEMAAWVETALGRFPVITVGSVDDPMTSAKFAYHELAHIWDAANGWKLGAALDQAMQIKRDASGNVLFDLDFKGALARHGSFATWYFNPNPPGNPPGSEHFADTVQAYFLFDVAEYSGLFLACWADEDPRCGTKFEYDRYDFVRQLFGSR